MRSVGMGAIFEGKVYDSVTVDNKGQIIIPSELRKVLNIKIGDELIIFAELEINAISLMPLDDFNKFLKHASRSILKLKREILINK